MKIGNEKDKKIMSDDQAFNDCPAGKEADQFHQRILSGLLDALKEQRPRFEALNARQEHHLGSDEVEFLNLHAQVQQALKRLEDPEMPYDEKYALAQQAQCWLMEMELL